MRDTGFGSFIELSWFQNLFYDIVWPELKFFPDANAYADFLTISVPELGGSAGIDAQNVMVYRVSVA